MVSLAKWVDMITRWAIYAISILVIYMLILKLTNHSPLFETIIAGGVGFLIVNTFKVENRFGKMENHMETTKRTFAKIGQEFDKMNARIDSVNDRLHHIENKVDRMDERMNGMDGRLARIERKLGA